MKKGDITYIKRILSKHHTAETGKQIANCEHSDCWYKRIIKELEELKI